MVKAPTKRFQKKNQDLEESSSEEQVDEDELVKDVLDDDEEDEEEESDDDDLVDEHHILPLNLGDEEDEEDEEEGDDDDGVEETIARIRHQAGDSDEEVDDKEPELGWGQKKKLYYSTDVRDEDEEERIEAEEEEVKRLQKLRAASLQMDDYAETFADLIKEKKERKIERKTDFDLKREDKEERIEKDINLLTEEEKLNRIKAESPELLVLLKDLKTKMNEIKDRVQPLLQSLKKNELASNKGLSFLEVKYHLLLSYCINVTFYLLLKASGKSIKDHPVINELIRIRTVLEKIKPLDVKLKYQIDKLLKTAAVGSITHAENDGLQYKPNPKALSKGSSGGSAELAAEAPAGEEEKTGLYRAPRISAVRYEEDEKGDKKKEKEAKKAKERAKKSSMLQFLREQFSEAPEEYNSNLTDFTDERSKIMDEEKKRAEFEEEHFMRLPLTKQDRSKRKKALINNEFGDLEDFADIGGLDKSEGRSVTVGMKKKEEQPNKKQKKEKLINDYFTYDDLEGEDELDDLYRDAEKQSKKKKKSKADKDQEIKKDKEKDFIPKWDGETEDGERREISYTMEKNKGLTKYRKKENRNPRKKYQAKFETALKKRRGAVREVKQQQGAYGGEATGIKKNTTKSVKLRI
eukprot:TRINITY_DN4067_c0_g1_i2.p1 TRINITY_DN4067_c0_g1~~TRINITY_DN4067_c0_g1_i2.p1  ORF type:complete len:650 (+),score=283.09 TRINITY_DN4067_c0_g1_i2:47-1951(+)